MTELKKVDILLKRYLKGRFSVTQSLVVTFLITGAISFGAGLSTDNLVTSGDQQTGIVQGDAAAGDYTPSGTLKPVVLPDIPPYVIPNVAVHPENCETVHDANNPEEFCNNHKGDVNFTGDYGMFVDDGRWHVNFGTIENVGNFGAVVVGDSGEHPGAIHGGQILNLGTIANKGDIGMLAKGYNSAVINGFKVVHEHKDGCHEGAEGKEFTVVPGVVANIGDIGMAAIGGGSAWNLGIVKNEGNYGMLAEGGYIPLDNKPPKSTLESGTEGAVTQPPHQQYPEHFIPSTVVNWGVYEKEHEHQHGPECEEEHTLVGGIVENKGDVGMAATKGAWAINLGSVRNIGDYGMLAEGGVESHHFDSVKPMPGMSEVGPTVKPESKPHPEIEFDFHPSLAINGPWGTVENKGDVGMAALDGAWALNFGTVANTENEEGLGGNIGMVASGGRLLECNLGNDHDHEEDDCRGSDGDGYNQDNFYRSYAGNFGTVANTGNYGMAALDGAIVENFGTVANEGAYGMVAQGFFEKAEEECTDGKNPSHGGKYEHDEEVKHSIALNFNTVANAGDIGMAALDGGVVKNFGLVENGEFDVDGNPIANSGLAGMIASGKGSLAVNYGKDLVLEKEEGHQCENPEEHHYLLDEGGVKNIGDYGMIAINGATAINKGLIANQGNVGMYIGNGSYGENWGYAPEDMVYENKYEHDDCDDTCDGNHSTRPDYGHVALEYNAGIKNTGNVGVYVDGNASFANYGTIRPEYKDANGNEVKESDQIAILTGTGNNIVKLGLTSDIKGDLLNLGGTDILYLGSNPKVDHPHGEDDNILTSESGAYHHKDNNTLDSNVWFYTHLVVGDPLKQQAGEDGKPHWAPDKNEDGKGEHKEFDWRVTGNIVLIPGAAVPGFEEEAGTLSYADYVQLVKDADVRKGLKGNLIVGEAGKENTADGANIAMIIGRQPGPGTQNLTTPTISGNSVNVEQSGKIINHTLDRAFITNADQLLVTNIYTNGKNENDECHDGRENGGIMIDGVDLDKLESARALTSEEVARLAANNIDTNGELVIFDSKDIANGNHIGIQTDNLADGWTGQYVYNKTTGELTLVVNRGDALGGFGSGNTVYGVNTVRAAGGYDVANYPQNNLDEVNARRITDKGYLYARRAAFMAPVVTTVQETVQYPAAPMDKGVKAAPVVTEKGKEVAPPPVIEEVVETKVYKNYDNLQYAEVFGDWGKYSGDGAEYSYDTYGVTGATFHRFDPNWLAGLAYGYAHSKVDYDNLNGSDENIDTLGLNGYVSYQNNNWLVTGQAGYAWSRHDLNRYTIDGDSGNIIGITDLKRKLDKKFDSNTATVGIEVGYNYKIDDNSYLYPYAGIDYVWNSADSYSENADSWTGQTNIAGGDALDSYAVHIDKNDYNTAVTKLGLMGQAIYERWTFTGDIAWMHYFSDYDNTTGYYLDAPGAEFVSYKQDPGKDVGYIMLAADYAVNEQLSVGADFTGYYRSNQTSSQVGLNLTYKF